MWIRQACKRSADRKPLGLSTALLTLRSMTFNSDCWLTRCETVALQLFGLLPYQNYDINGLTSSHWQLSAIGEMGCWYPVHFAAVHVHAMTKVIVGQGIFVDICCLAFSAANATPQRPCPARSTVLRTTLGCGIKYDADIVAGMTHRFEPRGTTFFLMAWRRGGSCRIPSSLTLGGDLSHACRGEYPGGDDGSMSCLWPVASFSEWQPCLPVPRPYQPRSRSMLSLPA